MCRTQHKMIMSDMMVIALIVFKILQGGGGGGGGCWDTVLKRSNQILWGLK